MSEKFEQFEKFIAAFKKAHPDLGKQEAHKEAIKQWKMVKKLDDPAVINNKMQDFRLKESQRNTKALQMWSKFRKSDTAEVPPKVEIPKKNESIPQNIEKPTESVPKIETVTQSRPAPIREKLSDEISVLKGQLFNMQSLENSGLSLVSHKEMSELKKKIVLKQKKETKLLNQAKTQKKYRDKKKDVIRKLRLVQWIQQRSTEQIAYGVRSRSTKIIRNQFGGLSGIIPGTFY